MARGRWRRDPAAAIAGASDASDRTHATVRAVVNPTPMGGGPMSQLAHALLCDACSDPIEPGDDPLVRPGPNGVVHVHRDPECAGADLLEEVAARVAV